MSQRERPGAQGQPLTRPPIHSYRVYCMLGDGELSEGSVWEAMAFASIYKLDNLVAILDINRLGQSDPAPLQHQMDIYQKRCEAFGYVWASDLRTLIAKETSYARSFVGAGAEPEVKPHFDAASLQGLTHLAFGLKGAALASATGLWAETQL